MMALTEDTTERRIKVCYLPIHHSTEVLGEHTSASVRPDATVEDLKDEIIKKHSGTKYATGVGVSDLVISRCKTPISPKETLSAFRGRIKHFDFSDESPDVEQLDDGETIGELGLAAEETLLVRIVPVSSAHDVPSFLEDDTEVAATPFSQIPGCESCFFVLRKKGCFSEYDLDTIEISSSDDHSKQRGYEHLRNYLEMLKAEKRTPEWFKNMVHDIGKVAEAFSYDDHDPDAASYTKPELGGMIHAMLHSKKYIIGSDWTGLDAHTIFFHTFAGVCVMALGKDDTMSGFGSTPWPLSLPVRSVDEDCHYTPQSSFFFSYRSIPRVIMQLDSFSHVHDRNQTLLSGAGLVRFVNGQLAVEKRKRNFILMNFYLSEKDTIRRYIMYQNGDSKEANGGKVFCFMERFYNTNQSRLRISKELCNLASWIKVEDDILSHVGKGLVNISESLQSKTDALKIKQSEYEFTVERTKGTQGGSDLVLEGHKVVEWTLTRKKPSRLFVVRRSRDGRDFVAKLTGGSSQESSILQYLHDRDRTDQHVIPCESTISSNLGKLILLPIRHSVKELMKKSNPADIPGRFIDFAEQLIEGVAFLHRNGVAHLDIKPENLVYTNAFKLQIIDFDVAVQVKGVDDMRCVDVGTPGYAAGEVEKGSYSPILADRYSCGVSIDLFQKLDEYGNPQRRMALGEFASQLMDSVPGRRPSLLEWSRLQDDVEMQEEEKMSEDEKETMEYDSKNEHEDNDGSRQRTKPFHI